MLRAFVALLAILAGLLLGLSSCRAPRVVTEYRTIEKRDTLRLTDSVYISRNTYQRGDTVFRTDTICQFGWRDRNIIEVRADSVPYPVEIKVPVRTRNWYDRATAIGFWALLSIFATVIAWWLIKRYYFHSRR